MSNRQPSADTFTGQTDPPKFAWLRSLLTRSPSASRPARKRPSKTPAVAEPVPTTTTKETMTDSEAQASEETEKHSEGQVTEETAPASAVAQTARLAPAVLVLIIGIIAALITGISVLVFGWHEVPWVIYTAVGLILAWAAYLLYERVNLDTTTIRPPPTLGWRRTAQRVLRAAGSSHVLSQSVEELYSISGYVHNWLVTHMPHGLAVEIFVYGPKGGVGKTTVVTNSVVISAENSKRPTLAVDGRDKMGNVAIRLGLIMRSAITSLRSAAGTTPSIKQVMHVFNAGVLDTAVKTYNLFSSPPSFHLDVLSSEKKDKKNPFDFDLFDSMMDWMRTIYSVIIYECGNDVGDKFDELLMDRCDVPVAVHNVNMQNSKEELLEALELYRELHADKIATHGILCVVETEKHHTREEFAQMFGFRPEQVFLIPYDEYFRPDARHRVHTDERPQPVVILDKIPPAAKLAIIGYLNRGVQTVTEARLAQNRKS